MIIGDEYLEIKKMIRPDFTSVLDPATQRIAILTDGSRLVISTLELEKILAGPPLPQHWVVKVNGKTAQNWTIESDEKITLERVS